MPTNTSNAIGMERQFSPQQQDVYQKQLQGIRSNTAGDLESSGGYRLARALGIAGGNLINEAKRMEEHRERKGEYIGKYAEEKNVDKFRDVQAILANAGVDEYADNEYTRAYIARAEGAKAMAELDNRYQEEVVDVKGWCNSQKEEFDRYNQFVKDHKYEYNLKNTPISAEYDKSDDQFFDDGMYEHYHEYAMGKMRGQEAQAADNRKVIRNASFRSQLDKYNSPEYLAKTSLDQQIKDLGALGGRSLDMGMTIGEVTSGWNEYIKERVQLNGGADDLDKLGEIVIYKDPDGKDIKLKDVAPMDSYKNMAVIQDGNLLEKDTVDAINSLSKCKTVAEYDAAAADLKKKNPRLYANLAERGTLMSLRENAQQAEEQAEKEQEQGMFGDGSGGGSGGSTGIAKLGQTAQETFKKVARGYLDACKNHQADYQGRPISDALGVFTHNKKGETIFVKASREDVINIGNEMLMSLMDGKHKPEEAIADFDVLVTAPGFAPFRQSLAESMNATLNGLVNLNVDKIDLRSNNDLQNLQLAMDLMRIDPVGAKQMYGTGNWTRLNVLRYLVPSSEDYWEFKGGQAGGGLISAVRKYGTKIATIGAGNTEYTQTKQSISGHFKGVVTPIRAFNNSYSVDTTQVPIVGFPSYAKTQAVELATMYRMAGVSSDAEAIQRASHDVAKQYGVVNMDGQTIWIPLVQLHGVALAEQNKAPAVRLMIEQTKKNINWKNPKDVLVVWDDTAQELQFQDIKTGRTTPVKNLVNQIYYTENQRKTEVKAQKQKKAQAQAKEQARRKANVQKQTQVVHKEAQAFNKAHPTNARVEKNKHRKGRQF